MVGSKHANILTSTVVSELSACRFRGEAVIELFPRLYAALEAGLGSDGASLLALPESGFSKVRQATIVTWYTDRIGTFRPLEALSQEERAAAESQLRERLQLAAERVDADARLMLQVALNLPSGEEDIWFDGETVVLTNWGFVKGEVGSQSPPLSAFLPAGFDLMQDVGTRTNEGGVVADVSDGDQLQSGPGSAAVAPQAQALSSEPVEIATTFPALSQAPGVVVSEVPAQGGGHRQAALWLSVVAVALGIFLIYLLWPGNLLYPSPAAGGAATAEIGSQQQNDALRSQISRLQTGLGGNICTAPNADELDGIAGLPVLPQSPPIPSSGDGANSLPADADRAGQTSPPAALPATEPPGGQGATQGAAAPRRGQDLINSLENGTVFVVGSLGDKLSLGSGFLVTPRLVLTNHHVVAGVQEGKLLVANRHLLTPLHARVVATSPGSDYAAEDFALLELEQETQLPRLALTSVVERLDSVIAAGYPSFVVSSDPSFAVAFHEGRLDSLSNIQLALTRGEITVMQPGPTGATVLAHSATISPGNSGGPLVDRCGRIVGINTFTKTEAESALRLNYALSASDAVRFLNSHGVTVTADASACSDGAAGVAQAAPQTPAAPPPTDPAPVAAPPPGTPTTSTPTIDTAPAPGTAATPALPPQAGQVAPAAPVSPPALLEPVAPAPPAAPANLTPANPPPSANEADELIAPMEPGQ